MDDPQRKAFVRQMFNTVAEGYDSPALRFFRNSAERLPNYLTFKGNEHVLDVATGTGNAAIALANYLPLGRVTGVDISNGMLEKARQNASAHNLSNVEFLEMDIENLQFDQASFDHANCSFCLFFVNDMHTLLSNIAARVRPGGNILSTCFTDQSFAPQADLFLERIRTYGVDVPEAGFKRLADEEKNVDLYSTCGLQDIRIKRENVGYMLENEQRWWDVVWFAGFRGLVSQLDQEAQEEFKQEHLNDVAKLITKDGLPLNVEVIFTMGVVPL